MNSSSSRTSQLEELVDGSAVIRRLIQLIDTAVSLNVVVAVCFASVGCFLGLASTGSVSAAEAIALLMTTWQIYIADRLVKHPEDECGSTTSGSRSSETTQRYQDVIKALMIVAVVIQAYCVIQQPEVIFGILTGVIGGAAYVIKLPLIRCRLKSIPCAKTFYIPSVCVAMALGATGEWRWAWQHGEMTLGVWALIAINALVFDIKDAERDFENGIYTFFNLFPYRKVMTAAVIVSVAIAACIILVSIDLPHLALSAAAVGTLLLLLPLYSLEGSPQVERYLTHVFEWNIALPLLNMLVLKVCWP